MKVDTIQSLMNQYNTSQRVSMIRFKHIWLDSKVICIKNTWNDSS